MAAGLAGVVVLVWPALAHDGALDVAGAGAVLVAALAWSWGSIRARIMAQPASHATASGIQLLAGGTLLAIAGVALGEPRAITPRSLLARKRPHRECFQGINRLPASVAPRHLAAGTPCLPPSVRYP